MHSLSSAFVLGYHGCDAAVGEQLLRNVPFVQSTNDYDWLGSGIYFWEANPNRALDWASDLGRLQKRQRGASFNPFVVGAVIDLGFCLDLISTNGIEAVEQAHKELVSSASSSGIILPVNEGGQDLLLRRLDCSVIDYLHAAREAQARPSFDTVRGVFTEAKPLYPGSGFHRKTHIQLCVRNPEAIKGVFRVPRHHFSTT